MHWLLQIDWLQFVNSFLSSTEVKVNGTEEVVVYAPEYLEKLTGILNSTLSTLDGRR